MCFLGELVEMVGASPLVVIMPARFRFPVVILGDIGRYLSDLNLGRYGPLAGLLNVGYGGETYAC